MYDKSSEAFIADARYLKGLEREALPGMLTQAYAQVVSARLFPHGPEAPEWIELNRMLGKLAGTYEVLTLLLPDSDENRAPTAFVAASAHYARVRARKARAEVGREHLTRWGISSELSAGLLFVIGEHQADAGEVARSLELPKPSTPSEALVLSLSNLISGDGAKLRDILDQPLPGIVGSDIEERATDKIWIELLKGVRGVASRMLGENAGDPQNHFKRVQNWLAWTDPMEELQPRGDYTAFSAPGPRHLSLLLASVARSLLACAVADVLPPMDVEPVPWRRFLAHYAAKRPVLWRNHIRALQSGFLDTGTSAVMSFPTGAGKSALAELRTAAEVLRGRSVVYLAPTRALVAQLRRELKGVLSSIQTITVRGFMDDVEDLDVTGIQVAVMTPEACLALIGSRDDALLDTGMVVFDECHLLSGSAHNSSLPSRRSVDANLALLQLLARAPSADLLLLSAMVSNGEQLAAWIQGITGRKCVALTDAWKPTRQVRGLVAYPDADLRQLKALLAESKAAGHTPASISAQLVTRPWAVFSQRQLWDRTAEFRTLRLLDDVVHLSANKFFALTPNRNRVAAQLAAALVRAGIKPLVFTQKIPDAQAIAKGIAAILTDEAMTSADADSRKLEIAAIELGTDVAVSSPIGAAAGAHHALLLPLEREFIEEVYRANRGLAVLVATPTLAQGMNLPAEAVIIAGDNRWEEDDSGGHAADLPVHEILNAAGRAGRAGMFAQGLVLDIPGSVVGFSETSIRERQGDMLDHGVAVFGRADQCVEVVDPLEQVLDRVAAGEKSGICTYFLHRLSLDDDNDGRVSNGNILRSSFGAHKANVSGQRHRYEQMVLSAISSASVLRRENPRSSLHEEISLGLGVSPRAIKQIDESLPTYDEFGKITVKGWVDWICSRFIQDPSSLGVLLNLEASGLLRIFKDEKPGLPSTREARAAQGLAASLPLWIGGQPLSAIEPVLFAGSLRKRSSRTLDLARRFSNETAPSIAGIASILRRFWEARIPPDEILAEPPLALTALSGCLRWGFNSPEKLAFHRVFARFGPTSRVYSHLCFAQIEPNMEPVQPWETMVDLEERIRDVAFEQGLLEDDSSGS